MSLSSLQSLLRDAIEQRLRNSPGNIFFDQAEKKRRDYEAIDKKWAEEAGRDFLLTRDKQDQKNDLAKQELVNAGQIANTETVNTGAMARQMLMEDTKRSADLNTFNRGIFDTQADIYKTQVAGNAKQPDNTLRGKEIEVAASILNNSTTDPNSTQAQWAMRILNAGQQKVVPQTATPAAQPAQKQFSVSTSFDNRKDIELPSNVSLFREETPNPARQMIQDAQNVPTTAPVKSLVDQEAEFNKTRRSATGFSLFNSPMEASAMRKQQDIINSRPTETEEERKKKQAANIASMRGWL